jgi:hypothetical protein
MGKGYHQRYRPRTAGLNQLGPVKSSGYFFNETMPTQLEIFQKHRHDTDYWDSRMVNDFRRRHGIVPEWTMPKKDALIVRTIRSSLFYRSRRKKPTLPKLKFLGDK